MTIFTLAHRSLAITGARISPSCSAWRRPWRCSAGRCWSATRCAAACAISRSAVSAAPTTSSRPPASSATDRSRRTCRRRSVPPPLIVATGFVTHEPSGRRAGSVLVYGVDERFWTFHGLEPPDGVLHSPALAAELGAAARRRAADPAAAPSEIPLESLFARKEEIGPHRAADAGRRAAARAAWRVLAAAAAGRRSARCSRRCGGSSAISASADQVNTVLVGSATMPRSRVSCALRDARATSASASASTDDERRGRGRERERHHQRGASEAVGAGPAAQSMKPATPMPVFTYLANTMRNGDRAVPYSLITAPICAQSSASAPPRLHARHRLPPDADRPERLDGARARRHGRRPRRDRVLPLGRQRRPPTKTASFTVAPSCRWPDSRPIGISRRSIRASPAPRAWPTGIRRFRSIWRKCGKRREVLGRLPRHAEGLHPVRARPRAVADAIRRRDLPAFRPPAPPEGGPAAQFTVRRN